MLGELFNLYEDQFLQILNQYDKSQHHRIVRPRDLAHAFVQERQSQTLGKVVKTEIVNNYWAKC